MSAAPARRLHLVGDRFVDDDTGEVVSKEVAEIERLRGDLKAAEKDLRAKRRIISELQRDKARERLDHPRYKDIERIARYWHRKCRGGNARVNPMSPERFDAVAGILEQERIAVDEETGKKRREPMYSLEECKAAIDGIAFDHYSKPRKNGTVQHYDDLELAFRDGKHFEACRDSAPRVGPPNT